MPGKKVEKIGFVVSAKAKKTVTVKVERLTMHPIYKKFVRRRSKFLAHDELGCQVGDKVRIIESRPLSARKRWIVKEIIQRALQTER
jgi:SSU ribosomal protein S17P